MRTRSPGFTLFEFVLTMGLFVVLITTTVLIQHKVLQLQEKDRATELVRAQILLARNSAMAGRNASNWGVRVQSGSVILFRGTSWAARNAAFDQTVPFSTGVSVSAQDVVFTMPTGYPAAAATIPLTSNGKTSTIGISKYGGVSVQ